jgi:hypothetical protein
MASLNCITAIAFKLNFEPLNYDILFWDTMKDRNLLWGKCRIVRRGARNACKRLIWNRLRGGVKKVKGRLGVRPFPISTISAEKRTVQCFRTVFVPKQGSKPLIESLIAKLSLLRAQQFQSGDKLDISGIESKHAGKNDCGLNQKLWWNRAENTAPSTELYYFFFVQSGRISISRTR